MPEAPNPKPRKHPYAEFYREPMLRSMHQSAAPLIESPPRRRAASVRYAELQVTSNFTFLTGGSHPDELVERAAELGHEAVAITDCNTVAGVVRAHVAAKQAGMPLVIGSRLQLATHHPDRLPDETLSILVYPEGRFGYAQL